MNKETNIKTRFQIFINNTVKPDLTYYEHNALKEFWDKTNPEISVNKIMNDANEKFKVVDIKLLIHDEEIPNLGVGFETALYGTRLPYNFEVQVFVKTI